MSVSRGTSQPRDQTWVSHIAGRFFTVWATREAIPKKKISFSETAYWAIQNILKDLNKGCWLITSIRVPPWGLKVQPYFPLLLRRINSPKTKLEAPRIRPLQVGRHLFERDIFCTFRCWKLGLFEELSSAPGSWEGQSSSCVTKIYSRQSCCGWAWFFQLRKRCKETHRGWGNLLEGGVSADSLKGFCRTGLAAHFILEAVFQRHVYMEWNQPQQGVKWSHSVVSDSLWPHGL